ncbi:hypothetical protein ACIA58_40445 [Kribbella sp. NPDC051586]|uniref:hypothetical protein n=1 Tax=Kribbella sp. NPDC051586 TaxID=3364118 RepID=UPI003791E6B2
MRKVCGVLAVVLLCLAGCSDIPAPAPASSPSPTPVHATPTPPPPPADGDLPRGGRVIFPKYQLVGYVGLPGSPALGPLDKDLDAKAAKLETLSRAYAAGRTPQPVLELIAVVARGSRGKDGLYRGRLDDSAIEEYLTVARKHKMLLLLDIQPGRAKILPEVKRLERWLKEPDVGLAFDPEWAVGPGQVPGRVFGHTTGAELDSIAAYLSGLVKANDLPEKVFVFHQLSARIVSDEKALKPHPGVVTIKSVDGIGARTDKLKTWTKLTTSLPPAVHAGFKLFYTEDARHGPLMTPPQVLALKPRAELVIYE